MNFTCMRSFACPLSLPPHRSHGLRSPARRSAVAALCRVFSPLSLVFLAMLPLRAQTLPAFAVAPSASPSGYVYIGNTVTLSGTATGTPAITYQWKFNDTPIAGATATSFDLSPTDRNQSGYYYLTATNAAGSVTSPPVGISVEPMPLDHTTVDTSFLFNLPGVGTAYPQADGTILVPGGTRTEDGSRIAATRLNPNGSIDPSFHRAVLGGSGNPYAGLLFEPNGKIVLIGQFSSVDGVAIDNFARLNADGTLDPSFTGDVAVQSAALALAPISNDRLLVLTRTGDQITVSRLTAEGAVDASFTSYILPAASLVQTYGATITSTSDFAGRLIVGVSTRRLIDSKAYVIRFLPDGQLDATFPAAEFPGGLFALQAVGPKIAYGWQGTAFDPFTSVAGRVGRLNEQGSEDSSFTPLVYHTPSGPDSDALPLIAIDSSGEFYLQSRSAVIRYDATGHAIPGSALHLDYSWNNSLRLQFLPNGQLLASGGFTTLNGIKTSRLARLNPVGTVYSTRLANLSLRTRAGFGDRTLIAGFVVAGKSGAADLLIRGIGPTLATLGISAPLADPHLQLYQEATSGVANDDWSASLADRFATLGAFPLLDGSKDAALETNLAPGVYTAHLTGDAATTGIALAEIYDASAEPASIDDPRLVNLSGRAQVDTGDDTLIAGFVVSGTGVKRILLRAVGPTLADYGIAAPLADPLLSLYRGAELMVSSSSPYGPQADSSEPREAAALVGAFSLAEATHDAAMVVDVSPGVYSVHVSSLSGGTGVALVEVYDVPAN